MKMKISNKIMMATGAILLRAISAAQEVTDTIAAQELQEIVIEAPKVIRKADMDVYHPSKSAVENSKNGLQLLNNLMIPTTEYKRGSWHHQCRRTVGTSAHQRSRVHH